MLDYPTQSSYVAPMRNYRKHPPIYYTIRTVVRYCFWTSVVIGGVQTAVWISNLNDKPACPISLNEDFHYTTNESFDPNTCSPGDNVVLVDAQHWSWAN